MSTYAEIPKRLSPRDSNNYHQKIPKIIWQTMKTNQVPVFMKNYSDTWIALNPEYEYRFCDDADIIQFLEKDFPDYLSGYNKLKYGASKADLWRYLVIYKYGGIYADLDCRCIRPLREWVKPDAQFVTQLGTNKDICQWLIMSVPENPIFLKAAQKTLYNSEHNNTKEEHYGFEIVNGRIAIKENDLLLKFDHEVLGISGPPVLQKAAEMCFEEGSISDILRETQVVCISQSTSCQMSGNVKHDTRHEQYIKALSRLQLKHYNSLFARIKRKLNLKKRNNTEK